MCCKALLCITIIAGSYFTTTAADSIKTSEGIVPLFTHTRNTATIGKHGIRVNGAFSYGGDAEYVTGVAGKDFIRTANNQPLDPGTSQQLTGAFQVGYGLLDNMDLSLLQPIYNDMAGWGVNQNSIADLELAVTYAFPQKSEGLVFKSAFCLNIILPTGNREGGLFPHHVYYVTSDPANKAYNGMTYAENLLYINPTLMGSFNLLHLKKQIPVELYLNVGAVFSTNSAGNALTGAAAFAYSPTARLTLSVEVALESRLLSNEIALRDALAGDPFWLTPGVTVKIPGGVSLYAAGDFGFSSGESSHRSNWYRGGYAYATKAVPALGGHVEFSWQITPWAKKKHAKTNPTLSSKNDSDNDGIVDADDKCPNIAEDKDGFEDEDGCNDFDNDKDGIVDESDGCPSNAEDFDGFEDNDGCPDVDNDGDGVLDAADSCPNVKGVESAYGCPNAKEIPFQKTELSGVVFGKGSSKLSKSSEKTLNHVYESMVEWRAIKIEFQVHTNNTGTAPNNLKLSQSRADALRLYLVGKGINPNRIKAIGFGEEFPIADNSTEEGRAKNERVEMRRSE